MTTVTIRKVLRWDMRKFHALRKHTFTKVLKPLEVLAAINNDDTIVRLIDSAGAVHAYYAERGEYFDIKALHKMRTDGVGITLRQPGAKGVKRAA